MRYGADMRAQSVTMGPQAAPNPRALRAQRRESIPQRRRAWRSAASSLVAAASFWAATASAQAPSPQAAPPITLTWSAPASCPDTAAVSARIDRLLGGPPKATDRRLEAVATVEAIPRGFRLEITLTADGATSGRILQGAICESVADAAALVIALAFDPEAVAAQEQKQAASEGPEAPPQNNTPPPPDTPPGPVPADSAAPSAPPPPAESAIVRIPVLFPPPRVVPAPPSEPASSITYGAFVQFAGDAGSLPGVAPGVRAGLSLGIGAFRIEPAFEAWPSSRSSVADRPGAGAEMRLLAGSLDVCRRIWPTTMPEAGQARVGSPVPGPVSSSTEVDLSSVIGCLGFEIGEMQGTGFGVAAPKSAGALWAAPRADLRAELSLLRHVALTLDLGLAVPVDRKTFVLTLTGSRAVVHEPSPVSGRAGAGVAVRF